MRSLVVFLLVLLSVGSLGAASPVIATARAQGEFRVDQATVVGNSTIFAGSVVETAAVPSEMQLRAGGSVVLNASSRGRILAGRVVLDRGAAQLRNTTYALETGALKVTPEDVRARVEVRRSGPDQVCVFAAGAGARVHNARGVLVARVRPGGGMEFSTRAGAESKAYEGTGILEKQGAKYFLVDQTTQVRVELRGENLDKMAGKTVHIQGSVIGTEATTAGESAIVQVASHSVVEAGAGAGAAAGIAQGMSGKAVAILGGVAAASVAGGLYGAGVIGGDEPPVSR